MKKLTFKKFVKEMVDKYVRDAFINEYDYTIHWMDEDGDAYAIIKIDDIYLDLNICIYPMLKVLYKKDPRKTEEIICHEICHVLTEPLYRMVIDSQNSKLFHQDTIENVRERQTQRICNALFNK